MGLKPFYAISIGAARRCFSVLGGGRIRFVRWAERRELSSRPVRLVTLWAIGTRRSRVSKNIFKEPISRPALARYRRLPKNARPTGS